MSHIKTFTGKHFDPAKPEKELLDIRDIAHALSLTCRGNGHVKTFFSVGQHCINCALEAEARGLSTRMILACLLHDAGEAYMSDVPRPFKHTMPEYLKAEDVLLKMVYEKFLGTVLSEEEEQQVKVIDDDMLYFDMEILLNEPMDMEKPNLKIELDFQVVPFEQVEQKYLELYKKYQIIK